MIENTNEVVNHSREYLESQEFDLIDSSIKEYFRKSLEEIFGSAEIDPMAIIYRVRTHPDRPWDKRIPYEEFVRVFIYTSNLTTEQVRTFKKRHPQAFMESHGIGIVATNGKLDDVGIDTALKQGLNDKTFSVKTLNDYNGKFRISIMILREWLQKQYEEVNLDQAKLKI
jgi:hypothetical protein